MKSREIVEYNKLTDTVPDLADRGTTGPAPAAGAAGDPVVKTREEKVMRATRVIRHGFPTAAWCAMALILVLGASLVAAPPAAAQANHLKVGLQGDTSNVDLHLTTHYVSRVALLNVYEMLYTLGEDLSIQPMLAEKHTISPDALTYTITVRKGVKFHNGKVMDAKDVASTLTRMRNQGCRSAEFKGLVKEVEATDASTVRFSNTPFSLAT